MTNLIQKDGWTLVHQSTGAPVHLSEVVRDFRGDEHVITGGSPPHKPGSTGRIFTGQCEFFPNVCKLKWVRESSSNQPPVDEVHEAVALLQRHIKAVRFALDSTLDQSITSLAREVADWEQDAAAQDGGLLR